MNDDALLAKLDELAKYKGGEPPPSWVSEPNNWGKVISEICANAAAEIRRHAAWVDDLQSGMYVNCVYCGHRYGPGETTPVTMADALKAHVAECPKHPMSALLAALKEMLDTHGKPQREEWISPLGFEHAKAVDARARQAIAAIDPGWQSKR